MLFHDLGRRIEMFVDFDQCSQRDDVLQKDGVQAALPLSRQIASWKSKSAAPIARGSPRSTDTAILPMILWSSSMAFGLGAPARALAAAPSIAARRS